MAERGRGQRDGRRQKETKEKGAAGEDGDKGEARSKGGGLGSSTTSFFLPACAVCVCGQDVDAVHRQRAAALAVAAEHGPDAQSQ
ncbi:hypothetical protein CDD83_11026 [Cordyceps sp. RAO-2017]|nr:hypothetical protein CDD83_11026 [Cordyceps sp. RAO-2017]